MTCVLVCGGRNYTNAQRVMEVLDGLNAELKITKVIHGCARGADILGGLWAKLRGIPAIGVHAEWDKFGKRAGYLRNIKMADMQPDVVVAFPGGKGTEMMIKIAKERNIKVVEVK